MNAFAERIKNARKEKGLSQQQLAKAVEVHYTNIGRYERGEATPSAAILNKIAQTLELSPDFLMNGSLENKAANAITDQLLLSQFKKVEKFPEDKKKIVIEFLDAFILKTDLQNKLAS